MLNTLLGKIIGTQNERELKRLRPIAARINELEAGLQALSDIEVRAKTDQFKETVVRVYNKRGVLVYEAIGLEKEWDGTYNGEVLPVDTYYYTIDLKLSFIKKTYKGAVMILR